jgi:hypothetical protein
MRYWKEMIFSDFACLLKAQKSKTVKIFNDAASMDEVARKVHDIYMNQHIHRDLSPYLDDPVTRYDIIEKLNELLCKNWADYFTHDERLYLHYTFWFKLRGIEKKEIDTILNVIKLGYHQQITISGSIYRACQLVRSLPLPFSCGVAEPVGFYWFDRGRWFTIPETRFSAIRKHVERVTTTQKDLFLPDYNVTNSSGGDTYKELEYNTAVITSIRGGEHKEQISEIILLDRELVSLGGKVDKFEFADILLQKNDGSYYFIHVKRESVNAIDHHRTQVERCALYLAENLDRSSLPGLLLRDVIHNFYENHVYRRDESAKQAKRIRGTSCRTKFNEIRKELNSEAVGRKTKIGSGFMTFLENNILNVKGANRQSLRSIATSPEIKTLLAQFHLYGDAVFRCLDALEDFLKSSIEMEEQLKIEETKTFLEGALTILAKHDSLTKQHLGVMPSKHRKRITIVLAIINDGTGNETFRNQQLWGIDQTRSLVENKGFNFQLVFIRDTSMTDKNIEISRTDSIQTTKRKKISEVENFNNNEKIDQKQTFSQSLDGAYDETDTGKSL